MTVDRCAVLVCTSDASVAGSAVTLLARRVRRAQDENGDVIPNPTADANTPEGTHGLMKTPRPLPSDSFMGDVVTLKVRQNQAFKFVFKRKIYLKHMDDATDDLMFERLVYLQVRDEGLVVVSVVMSLRAHVCVCARARMPGVRRGHSRQHSHSQRGRSRRAGGPGDGDRLNGGVP